MTIIFSVSFPSPPSPPSPPLLLVGAAIRHLMTTANLALSCFMVIVKQLCHFPNTVNGLLCFVSLKRFRHFITFNRVVEALQWSDFK